MERRNKTIQSETKRIISKLVKAIIEIIIYSILLWQLLACTNSLFIVKGYGNHVNQKAEQTTKTKVDSITTNVDAK